MSKKSNTHTIHAKATHEENAQQISQKSNIVQETDLAPKPAQPMVTVIVPVYNAADCLPLCLDSLLFQTLQELEIILVNDGSTDNSQQVIDEYVAKFPTKIRAIMRENGGSAAARKTGFEQVTTPFVMFVDADDYIDYHTCEKMLQKAMDENADVVYGYGYRFDEKKQKYDVFGRLTASPSYEEILLKGLASLAGRLFRVEFVKKYMSFEDNYYEDAAACVAMYSHTKKICYLDSFCYAYITSHENSKTANYKNPKVLDTVAADELLWRNVERKYRPITAARLLNRINNESERNYVVYDAVVQHAKDFAYKILPHEKEIAKYCGTNKKQFYALLLEPDEMIPMIVYCNGFDNDMDRNLYLNRIDIPFIGDYKIVWLDKSNCDLCSAPDVIRAHYEAGHMDMVAAWFAVNRLQQTGGIYIGVDIRVVNTFNRLRFNKTFFGFAGNQAFNDRVFGGQANQGVWDVLMSIMQRPNIDNMQQAISLTLCGWGGVHLNGKQQTIRDSVTVLKSNVLTTHCDRYANRNVCVYLPKFETPEEYYAFFKQGLEECYAHLVEAVAEPAGKAAPVGKAGAAGKVAPASAKNSPDMARMKNERDAARQELDAIKDTLSWKVTKPLRAVRTLLNKVKK